MKLFRVYKDKVPKRLIKESPQLPLSDLRKILGEEYVNTCFIDSSDFKVEINNENNINIEEIASEKGEIFTKTEETKKIKIFYNNHEYSKVDYLPDFKKRNICF